MVMLGFLFFCCTREGEALSPGQKSYLAPRQQPFLSFRTPFSDRHGSTRYLAAVPSLIIHLIAPNTHTPHAKYPHQVPAIRLVNQAQLIALAVDVYTGVLVDIGESGLSVTPIYGGCPVAPAVRAEPCGGADVTKFLDYMLLSRTNEQFNQMVRTRPLELFFLHLLLYARS